MKSVLYTAAFLLVVNAAWERAAAQGTEPAGPALYRANCRQCHGVKGTPPKTMKAKYKHIRDLSDSALMSRLTDDSMVVVIKKGVNDEKEMKGFADKLTLEEIKSVVKYVRTLSAKPKEQQ